MNNLILKKLFDFMMGNIDAVSDLDDENIPRFGFILVIFL